MKKLVIIFFILVMSLALNARSENLEAMVEVHRAELEKVGWRIIDGGYADLNVNRSIYSSEFTFNRQYAILLFIDGCISADIYLVSGAKEVELEHQQECISNVTRVITSVGDVDITGRIAGTISSSIWHDAYLMIAVQ